MDVQTITMPKRAARAALQEYRKSLHKRADAEYSAVEAVYREVANGRSVINLSQVVRDGGFDEYDRPNLAIARADRKTVLFGWDSWRDTANFETRIIYQDTSRLRSPTYAREVNLQRRPRRHASFNGQGTFEVVGSAMVPMIPAEVRNSCRFSDSDTFILWEVKQWAGKTHLVRPDSDPLLLRHIKADLYAILAEWDLSPVEQAIMAAFRADGER